VSDELQIWSSAFVYIYCDILWMCIYVAVCNVWQERPGECVGVGVGEVEAKKDKWQANIMIKQDYIKLKMSGVTICSNREDIFFSLSLVSGICHHFSLLSPN